MPIETFRSNAAKTTCGSMGTSELQASTTILNGSGGYLHPPEGLYASAAMTTLRWAAGEPVWCEDTQNFVVPFRYYTYPGSPNWGVAASAWGLGAAAGNAAASTKIDVTCANASGVRATYSANSNSAQASASGSNAQSSFSAPIWPTSTGMQTYSRFFTGAAPAIRNQLLPTGACKTLIEIKMTTATDAIGGYKTFAWSAARAMNGVPNVWSDDDIETLNCNIPTPPQECVGQNTTPYLIACGKVTIDPGTWGNLGPCMLGTPDDYLRGVSALDDDLSMPLPGSGTCGPMNFGTVMDVPFVIDVCGWYPQHRWAIDLLMTAALWIGVVMSVFRTRSGEN